ncbi:MAG: D-alanyl-D-alanine carboxypeptidase [Clostridia bacterium]|nr:D-alanyl-D-alanine carboxypeptidase [Clostridia bacterium]
MMKFIKLFSLFLTILMLSMSINISALTIKNTDFDLNVKSAVLMDANTGTVLYEKNMNESLPPASVTKIMTLLLVFDAIKAGTLNYKDMLTVSENAASMGGSQVYLEPGESMSVDELLKCVIIASANDAALTLAEHVAGSEEAFVSMMNEKAKELGMKNTNFENVTGLDDEVTNHTTSAYDIALMSKELLKHQDIQKYTTIWMDTIRNGEFGLSNTNRLVKFYKGITGLKTGSTNKAGFCVSASAKRGNLHLIAVIMGAPTSNDRNIAATKLLDYGFANYGIYSDEKQEYGTIKVIKGKSDEIKIGYDGIEILENLGNESKVEKEIIINENVCAPIKAGDEIGSIKYKLDGKILKESKIVSLENCEKMNFFEFFVKAIKNYLFI